MEVADFSQLVPRDFARMGFESLEMIAEFTFRPRMTSLLKQDLRDYEEDLELNADFTNRALEPIPLSPLEDETPVFGVDTSNIELGETSGGMLCAVRGAIVWRENRAYQYVRHGPFIFHVTEANRRGLYNILRQVYLDKEEAVGAPILEKMSERIRSILERWLQRQLCQSCSDSLLLFDGSLTTRTVNSPISVLGELLQNARSRNNIVLALSKKTTLSVAGQRVTDLIDNKHAPCLSRIDETAISQYGTHLHLFGRIYGVKFMPSYFTFRLDIDRKTPEEEGVQAVKRLLGNDLIVDNYPETLRLAHVLSRFSASEVIAMQRYVSENYKLRIIRRPDVRQVLFGPYGGYSSTRRNGVNVYDADLQT